MAASTQGIFGPGYVDGVLYAVVDFQGMFIDAVSSGYPANSTIVGYRWDKPDRQFHAAIRNNVTGVIATYEIDTVTRKPRLLDARGAPAKRPPRMSWEMKVWRATKCWQER